MREDDLYIKGLETMKKFLGEEVVTGFSDPQKNPILDWDKEIIPICFGNVYSRPNLDLRSRALCAIAALTVLGQWEILEKWLQGAKTAGVADHEIMEVIFQMSIYGGFPNSRKALQMAREAFSRQGENCPGENRPKE